MKAFFAILVGTTLGSRADGDMAVRWSDCSSKDNSSKIDTVVVAPNQPKFGQPLKIELHGALGSSKVPTGTLRVKGKEGWIQIFDYETDLCSDLDYNMPLDLGKVHFDGMTCGADVAQEKLSFEVLLSEKIQHLTHHATLFLTPQDSDGKEINCVRLDIEAVNPPTKDPLMIPPYYPVNIQRELQKTLGSTITFTWDSKCTTADAKAEVTDMSFEGNTLGQEIIVGGKGNFHEAAVQGTTYKIVVSAMNIPLMVKTNDFCKDTVVNLPMGMGTIKMKGLGCPTSAGPFELKESLTLSPHIVFPRASVQLSALDANGGQYFCVNMEGVISSSHTTNPSAQNEIYV